MTASLFVTAGVLVVRLKLKMGELRGTQGAAMVVGAPGDQPFSARWKDPTNVKPVRN